MSSVNKRLQHLVMILSLNKSSYTYLGMKLILCPYPFPPLYVLWNLKSTHVILPVSLCRMHSVLVRKVRKAAKGQKTTGWSTPSHPSLFPFQCQWSETWSYYYSQQMSNKGCSSELNLEQLGSSYLNQSTLLTPNLQVKKSEYPKYKHHL